MMNEFHKNLLLRNRVRLVNDLQSETLINYMIQDGIMMPNDSELLKSKQTAQYKNEYFLDFLATRGPNAFACFVKALKESEDYPLYEFVNNLATQPVNMDINQHYTGLPQQGPGGISQHHTGHPHQGPGGISQHHTGHPHQVSETDSGILPGSTQTGRPQQVPTAPGSLPGNANQYAGHPQQVPTVPGSLPGNANQYAGHPQQVSPDVADGPNFAGHQMPSSISNENLTKFPDRRLNEIDLNTFSGKMGQDWRSFIRSLGLRENDIFHAASGAHTERDKIFCCLVKWRNREANKATVRALVKMCYENEIDIEVFDFLRQ